MIMSKTNQFERMGLKILLELLVLGGVLVGYCKTQELEKFHFSITDMIYQFNSIECYKHVLHLILSIRCIIASFGP